MERTETGELVLRLGFRQIRSMREEDADWLTAARGNGYRAVEDVWRRAGLDVRTLTVLAEADAFASLGLSRRDALWAARALTPKKELPLFAGDLDGEGIVEGRVTLPEMTEGEEVVEDYVAMRLTLRTHPVALIRHRLSPGIDPRWLRPREALPAE
jgi:DNA polymerase III alpha subunit